MLDDFDEGMPLVPFWVHSDNMSAVDEVVNSVSGGANSEGSASAAAQQLTMSLLPKADASPAPMLEPYCRGKTVHEAATVVSFEEYTANAKARGGRVGWVGLLAGERSRDQSATAIDDACRTSELRLSDGHCAPAPVRVKSNDLLLSCVWLVAVSDPRMGACRCVPGDRCVRLKGEG
jgi:hypothetical protein